MSKNQNSSAMTPFDPSIGYTDKRISIIDVAKKCSIRIGVNPSKNQPANLPKCRKKILQLAWVTPDKIFINYERQRWPEPKHQAKLLKIWNINCVTPLQCRYDPVEDRYYAADGQQHMIVWLMKYGYKALIPCFYVTSTDPSIETDMLVSLNTENMPMSKYFIHKQKCMMGDKEAMNIEKAVVTADCEIAYRKSKAGCITHISNLYEASRTYGNTALTYVLARYREFWPTSKIEGSTLLGLLKLRDIMIKKKVFTTDLFEDMLLTATSRFEGHRLHLDINDAFKKQFETNYKGMGAREKIASGILSVYEQCTGTLPCSKPFDIEISLIKQ